MTCPREEAPREDETPVGIPLSRLRDSLASGSNPLSPATSYTQVVGLPLGQGCLIPKGSLRYVAPCAGGWGILRGAMQVPESVALFQAPLGCGRHGSLAAVMNGYRDRIYYIDMSEDDVVMGTHMDRLEDAVEAVMRLRATRPRAFWLFSTCVDDLLGSDYPNVAARMGERYGLPFVDGHMDPVTMTSSTPPPVKLQRGIYRFLTLAGPVELRDDAVNVIGNFATVDEGSELYEALRRAGITRVRQLPACSTFDEFLEMREAGHNILLKPFGRLACEDLRQELGMPYHLTRMPYDLDRVGLMYRELSEFLGRELDVSRHREEALGKLEDARPRLSGLRVAVGSNLNGSTFEVAAVLARLGARIAFLVAEEAEPADLPFVEDLCRADPDIPVYPGTHPRMSLVRRVPHEADVAIGYDAARLAPGAAPLPMGVDVQPFGYEATTSLVGRVLRAGQGGASARDLLYADTLVV